MSSILLLFRYTSTMEICIGFFICYLNFNVREKEAKKLSIFVKKKKANTSIWIPRNRWVAHRHIAESAESMVRCLDKRQKRKWKVYGMWVRLVSLLVFFSSSIRMIKPSYASICWCGFSHNRFYRKWIHHHRAVHICTASIVNLTEFRQSVLW